MPRLFAFVLAMALLALSSVSSAKGEQVFEQASRAFQAGQYEQAIPLFRKAEQQGYNQHVVAYNLGVSYFKLGDYKSAEKAFLQAVKSRNLRQIVEYNIGLVYTKQGHNKAAQAWFKAAANSKRYGQLYNKKIGALALDQLSLRSSQKKPPATFLDKLDGAIRIGYGHDDDVTDPATTNATSLSDTFIESYAYLKADFDIVQLGVYYYEQNFSEVNPSDFDEKEIALFYPINTQYGKFTPSIHLIVDELDHNDYLDTTDLRLAYRYKRNKDHIIKARLRYSDIESPDGIYSYLDGTRYQVRVDNLLHTAYGKLRLRFEYENNNRQNLATENFSPVRHSVWARLQNNLTSVIKMRNELSYRISEYDAATIGTREDKRLRYQFTIYGDVINDLELGLQYRYTDNASTIASKDYTSNVIKTYLTWYY